MLRYRNRRGVVRALLAALMVVAAAVAPVAQPASEASTPGLLVSLAPDRSSAVALDGQVLWGNAYVFVGPEAGVKKVQFWVDNPARTGPASRVEHGAPFDLQGGTAAAALAWDTTKLSPGQHSVTAFIETTTGNRTVTSTFTVDPAAPKVAVDPTQVVLTATAGGGAVSSRAVVSLAAGATGTITAAEEATWLAVTVEGSSLSLVADPTGLPVGQHKTAVTVSAPGHLRTAVPVTLQVVPAVELSVSHAADRSGAVALEGQVLWGDVYVFVGPDKALSKAQFWIDDPTMARPAFRTESLAPFDLMGGSSLAAPWDLTTLPAGTHTVTALVDTSGGRHVITSTFTVQWQGLVADPGEVRLSASAGGAPVSTTVTVTASDASTVTVTATDDAAWLATTLEPATTPGTLTLTANPAGLAAGTHTGTVTLASPGLPDTTVTVTLAVASVGIGYSTTADRANPRALDGQALWGDAYVFVWPDAGVTKAEFWIDNPTRSGPAFRTESLAPFDLMGGTTTAAIAWDTTTLSPGTHTLTIATHTSTGQQVTTATFTVDPSLATYTFTPARVQLSAAEGDGATQRVVELDLAGSSQAFTVTTDVPWLSAVPAAATTPSSVTLTIDPGGLPQGVHLGSVTASGGDRRPAVLPVELTIGPACSPLDCEHILVQAPYTTDWAATPGGILDGGGSGTGFTTVLDPPGGDGYRPGLLRVDRATGRLHVTTTSGIANGADNNQLNALGVGIDGASQDSILTATLVDLPTGSGGYEQAGLWIGNDQDNYAKLVVLSTPDGPKVELRVEDDELSPNARSVTLPALTGEQVLHLYLRADPLNRIVRGSYRIADGPEVIVATFPAEAELFSFDAAGIDPRIGTRTFGGIWASHRRGPAPVTYQFSRFALTAEAPGTTPAAGGGTGGGTPGGSTSSGLPFDRVSIPVPMPTAMVWGPDGRLYVAELFGTIHALTLDADKQLVDDEVITTLGSRLTLGLAIDPRSSATDVRLWAAHSSPSVTNGAVNSSTVTELSGAGFSQRRDVITGLPRAIANHAINSIHFDPTGDRLFIAVGGNTGAGAPNTANTEFGERAEQPLSAAILVADVRNPAFDGTCANTADMYGPAPCDVRVHASGLRNSYDFVFHSGGQMYATDNGLGVTGSFPPSPTAPCTGFGNTTSWEQGGHNPGSQPDSLYLIEEGAYYGHPNPSRGECVFKDGSYQGVQPLASYRTPITSFGNNKSVNGVIEYTDTQAHCGALTGDLIVASYSLGDDLTRVVLSDDGRTVVRKEQLATGFNDPLPLTLGPDGTIYVGEFGGSQVTALVPVDQGCWSGATPLPVKRLDAGGAGLDGKVYVVGGKDGTGHKRDLFVYDPATASWSQGPSLPGVGVENPAVVAHAGKLWVFGGSTSPFSGAVANAASYDPVTGTWTSVAPMQAPRSGAAAQVVAGRIFVAGGMDAAGTSLASVEVFDPATGAWSWAPAMGTRRDNAGSASIDGVLYVVGGRTRNADGSTPVDALATGERLDPVTGTWQPIAALPTARRTMVSGVIGGRLVLAGGEAGNTVISSTEELDPATGTWRKLQPLTTPRHGAAGAVVDGRLHVVAGGTSAGSSFSDIHEVLQ